MWDPQFNCFFVIFNVHNFVLFDQFVLKSQKVVTLVMNDDDDVICIVCCLSFATRTIHDNDVMVCTSFVFVGAYKLIVAVNITQIFLYQK